MKGKIAIIVIVILIGSFLFLKPYYDFAARTLNVSIIKTIFSMDSLKRFDNQVNVLLLGIAGGKHEGPNLSDSIIVANYNFSSNQLTTTSLPRDIWSETLRDKINSAYAYGEAKKRGGGLSLSKAEISSIVGMPIAYAVVIDFSKFEEIIDFLGGVDVRVERSFTDRRFPIAGKENDLCGGDPDYDCRYKTVSFSQGLQHMNGETALTFVRSRHAEGKEGSDFARSQRQQKVLEAVKNRLLKTVNVFDIKKVETLYKVLDSATIRDISNQQIAILVKTAVLSKNLHQKEVVLGEDFFEIPNYAQYDGKYVLVPSSGNFERIHRFVSCQIQNQPNCN